MMILFIAMLHLSFMLVHVMLLRKSKQKREGCRILV